jgi:hypothetical protein
VTESRNKSFIVSAGMFRKSQFHDIFVATGSWRYKKSSKCLGLQKPEGDAKLQWLVEGQTFFRRRSWFVRDETTNCDLGPGESQSGRANVVSTSPLRVACIGMGWWSDVLADAIQRSGRKTQRLRGEISLPAGREL